MKTVIILILSMIGFVKVLAQKKVESLVIDSSIFLSQKYIFRALIVIPSSQDDHARYSGIFSLNTEKTFKYNFTLSTKIGVASSTKDFGTPEGKYQTSYHFLKMPS